MSQKDSINKPTIQPAQNTSSPTYATNPKQNQNAKNDIISTLQPSQMQPMRRKCICNAYLTKSTVKDRLKNSDSISVVCDGCYQTYRNNDVIFYCKNKSEKHPEGYDLCMQCTTQHTESPSNIKMTLLRKMGYTVSEIGEAFRALATNADVNEVERYLIQQKRIAIDKENEINRLMDCGYTLHLKHSDKPNDVFTSKSQKHSSELQTSCDIKSCVHLEIVLFALNNLYQNGHEVDGDNILLILNAFLHLIATHNDDEQFEFIFDNLQCCDLTQCDVFQRHYRSRSRTKLKQNNINYNAIEEIMDKIHCYYLHCYDVGQGFSRNDRQYIMEEKKNDENDIHRYAMNRRIHKIICQKHKVYQSVKQMQNRKTSKFNQIRMNTADYSFGVEFNYFAEEKLVANDNDEPVKGLTIKPKYASLKEELIMNDICIINTDQFNNEYAKASLLFATPYRKNTYCDMKIYHLLVLMMYCNFDTLQNEFSRTYRKLPGETDEEIAERHQNFYFMGSYLKFAVNEFGSISYDALYHGINEKLVFPAYLSNIVVNSPLSTTSSFSVAANFAQLSGLIIQFEPAPSHAKKEESDRWCVSFPVAWLSDYGNEREHLYVQCNGVFEIKNIVDMFSGNEYDIILAALDFIDNPCQPIDMSLAMKMLIQRIIDHQLSKKLACSQSFSSLDAYSRGMVNVFCQNKTYCEISYGQKIFTQFHVVDHQWINLKLVYLMFPNAQIIHIRNVNLCSFSVMCVLQYLGLTQIQESSLLLIWIKPMKKSDLNISEVIYKYKEQFEALNFEASKLEDIGYKETKSDIGYLSIERIGSSPKFVTGKSIVDKPQFATYYYFNYDEAKNKTQIKSGNSSKIRCSK